MRDHSCWIKYCNLLHILKKTICFWYYSHLFYIQKSQLRLKSHNTFCRLFSWIKMQFEFPCRHTWWRCSVLLVEHWVTVKKKTDVLLEFQNQARTDQREGWPLVDAMALMEELLKNIRRSCTKKSRRKIVRWMQKCGIWKRMMKCAKCNRSMHLVKCNAKDGLWW